MILFMLITDEVFWGLVEVNALDYTDGVCEGCAPVVHFFYTCYATKPMLLQYSEGPGFKSWPGYLCCMVFHSIASQIPG